MNDLKPRFSFFPPDGGFFSCRTQPPEPCLKSKCHLVGARATQNRQGENKNIFSRNRGRGGVQSTNCFRLHLLDAENSLKTCHNRPVFVQETPLPLLLTHPAYSAFRRNSIMSAGWQSNKSQIVSSTDHEGICPLLIF